MARVLVQVLVAAAVVCGGPGTTEGQEKGKDGGDRAEGEAGPSKRLIFTEAGTSGERRFWHGASIYDIAAGPGDRWLVAAGRDGRLGVWDVASGRKTDSLDAHEATALCVDVSKNGGTIVSGGGYGWLSFWEPETGRVHRAGGVEPPAAEVVELFGFRNDESAVRCVAVSPDGARVAVGRGNSGVELWDMTGKRLRTFAGHPDDLGLVDAVAWSPTGEWFVTGGSDEYLRIWDPETGKLIREMKGPGMRPHGSSVVDIIRAVGISPDSKLLLSGGGGASVQLWETETGRLVRTLPSHKHSISAATFGPSGRWIASGGVWDQLRWWETSSGKELHPDTERAWTVDGDYESLVLAPDGAWAVTAGQDGVVRVWDMHTGEETLTLKGHRGVVRDVATNGELIVSGGEDTLVHVWRVRDGSLIRRFDHRHKVSAVEVSPDGRNVAAGDGQWTAIWDIETGKRARWLETEGCRDLAYSSDGTRLLVGSFGEMTVGVWETATGRRIRTFREHESMVQAVAWSGDGGLAASVSADGVAFVWDTTTGEVRRRFSAGYGWLLSVAVSPDGEWVVAGGHHRSLKVWEVETGNLRCEFASSSHITGVDVGPDGKWVVSAGRESPLRMWDPRTAQRIRPKPGRPAGHAGAITTMIASRDGTWLATGSSDGCIKLWDTSNNQELRTPTGHLQHVTCLVADPKGDWVASGSADATVRLWDATTGAALQTLLGHERAITALAVAGDGRKLVSGSSDRRITVWNAETGESERTWQAHRDSANALVVTTAGKILSAGLNAWAQGGSSVKTWELKTGKLVGAVDDFSGPVNHMFVDPSERYFVTENTLGERTVRVRDFGRHKEWDCRIRVWDMESGKTLKTVAERERQIYSAALSPDGSVLATAGIDRKLKLWAIPRGELIREMEGGKGAMTALAFSNDGRWLLACSTDPSLKVWEVSSGTSLGSLKVPVVPACMLVRESVVWLGMADGTIRRYEVRKR